MFLFEIFLIWQISLPFHQQWKCEISNGENVNTIPIYIAGVAITVITNHNFIFSRPLAKGQSGRSYNIENLKKRIKLQMIIVENVKICTRNGGIVSERSKQCLHWLHLSQVGNFLIFFKKTNFLSIFVTSSVWGGSKITQNAVLIINVLLGLSIAFKPMWMCLSRYELQCYP